MAPAEAHTKRCISGEKGGSGLRLGQFGQRETGLKLAKRAGRKRGRGKKGGSAISRGGRADHLGTSKKATTEKRLRKEKQ